MIAKGSKLVGLWKYVLVALLTLSVAAPFLVSLGHQLWYCWTPEEFDAELREKLKLPDWIERHRLFGSSEDQRDQVENYLLHLRLPHFRLESILADDVIAHRAGLDPSGIGSTFYVEVPARWGFPSPGSFPAYFYFDKQGKLLKYYIEAHESPQYRITYSRTGPD